ncbi:MAG: LacI family transcriptional regulator [Paenibacillaceae bacterium]|nr:LacI family transcriptional regulator [Paenibacillaceae bacterium]
MNRKKVTMESIAKELGLSRITVSKALRGLPGMSLETRRAVLALADKTGYLTKERKESELFDHTSLMSLQPRRFMMVLQDKQPSFSNIHMELIKGLNERYQESNYQVSPIFMNPAVSKEPAAFQEWVEQNGINYSDGIFIPPMMPPDLEELLLKLPVHRILFNFPPIGANVDSVIWDVYDSVRQAVRLLILKGHRNILYIGDITSARGFRLRWLAFCETMAEYGLAVDPVSHLTASFDGSEQWQQQFQHLLHRNKPTAILSAIEHNLPWVYYFCGQAGMRIPDDCSLVSLDIAESPPTPGLSYYRMPIRETGYRAADRMIWRIANPGLPYEHIRLQCRYIEGTSIRGAPAKITPPK